jgi:hypothetical protein
MWIWELQFSQGGNLDAIISSAHRYGIRTVMIKSSDGITFWSSQFTPQVVAALHSAGLRVCAWQYVYGNHPVTEAYMGADAVRDGADCLVIDAETEYEGKYVAAQTYLGRLRQLVGGRYPLALAGFPYIDFHPGFPYSVFLGPGGAQFNVPQMYWRDIGVTTDAVFVHTYAFNSIYRRPIYPLGQLYNSPPWYQIVRFRKLARVYGSSGVSWWDWQQATPSEWISLSRPAGSIPGYAPDSQKATIAKGSAGDLVVWAQEHLISAGYPVAADGSYGAATQAAVLAFQVAHGLVPDGRVGTQTWGALLHYPPARIVFGARAAVRRATLLRASRAGGRGIRLPEPVPKSASLPAKRDEIPGAGGAGRPKSPR